MDALRFTFYFFMKLRLLAFFFLLILSACAEPDLVCNDALGCVAILPNEPIRIGYLLAESGPSAFLGQDSKGGIEIAIEDRAVGLLDHQIELVGGDTGCNPEQGQAAVEAFLSDTAVLSIIGANCSNVTKAVMPDIHAAGLTMISPSNTAAGLMADQVWSGSYARTISSVGRQAEMAATFGLEALGGQTAVTLHDGSEYGRNLAQTFAEAWRDGGGIVIFEHEIGFGQTDLSAILTDLSFNTPDVLYLPLFEPEANYVVNSLRQTPGLGGIALIGGENLLVSTFPQSAGQAAEGMYVTGTAVTGAAYDLFLVKWGVKYGDAPPSIYHAHAYDAANILLTAVETVAQQSPNGTLLIGRQELRDAIINTANFPGLTGNLTCSPAGECASGEALGIYQITAEEIAGNFWPPPLVWQPPR